MKWLVLALVGSLGISALTGGLIWLAKRYQIIKHGMEAEGVVIGQHEENHVRTTGRSSRYSQTRTSYYPVVEFTNAQGETVRFQGSSGGVGKPLLETGTVVKVVYVPSDPVLAVIGDFNQTWLGPVVLSVVGAVFLIMALGSFFMIGSVDRTMEEMGEVMKRDALPFKSDTIRIEATISEIREIDGRDSGKYVLVCKGLRPGSSFSDEFLSEHFTFRPDSAFIGRTVFVYLDPVDKESYSVELGPLLKEILRRRDETGRRGTQY